MRIMVGAGERVMEAFCLPKCSWWSICRGCWKTQSGTQETRKWRGKLWGCAGCWWWWKAACRTRVISAGNIVHYPPSTHSMAALFACRRRLSQAPPPLLSGSHRHTMGVVAIKVVLWPSCDQIILFIQTVGNYYYYYRWDHNSFWHLKSGVLSITNGLPEIGIIFILGDWKWINYFNSSHQQPL